MNHEMRNSSELGIPKLSISQAIRLLTKIAKRINSAGNQGIFLWGPPGIGKSDLVRKLAETTNRTFVDIRLSTIDPVDLRGLPQINQEENITKWIPPDFLPHDNNVSGILFLDEINAAPPSVQAAAYQLILDRKLGTYQVPPDWLVIAAGNRINDRSVVFRLPTALANRFTHLEIYVDANEWYTWAWENGIDRYIISFLKYQPDLLLQFDPGNQQLAFPTPRSWAFASTFQDLRDEDLQLYHKGIHGTIGPAVAQQFLAFIQYREVLPDPNIILNGQKYEIPDRPDAQFVMMASLLNALMNDFTDTRIKHYFDYVNKYQNTAFADYAVILVRELLQATQIKDQTKSNASDMRIKVTSHPAYENWVQKNVELLS